MLKATRRRLGSGALLAFGLAFILPAMAEAQLFPNRPIKRQRESCASEPPFYKQVKQEYYGYFPTCWSKFPAGWACPCPNPELPNAAAAFQARPRDTPRDVNPADLGPGMDPEGEPGMEGDAPVTDPALPPVPDRGRSAFDMDGKPEAPGNTAPVNPAPLPGPGRPGVNPANPGGGRVPPPTTLRQMPGLPAVAPSPIVVESRLEPGSMSLAPDATLASNDGGARPNLGPLPSMPMTNPGTMPVEEPMIGVPAQAQAPQRRSLLGGLFGSSNRRRR